MTSTGEIQQPVQKPGLRDVIAGKTNLCLLDEKNAKLFYRGYSVEELAEHATFEAVAHLLLFGEFPAGAWKLGSFYTPRAWKTLRAQPSSAHPMDLLATFIRALGNEPRSFAQFDGMAPIELDRFRAAELIAETGYGVGLVARQMRRKRLVSQKPELSYAGNILYVLSGTLPDEYDARAMDISLILYAEHEFNASSSAVRLASSAHTDLYSAIVAGIGVLRGTRHGGANEEAMQMMLKIKKPENVKPFAEAFFEKPGARLPGFGHAVYRTRDPRVSILRPLVRELSQRKGTMQWYEMTSALEEHMAARGKEKGKEIPANVDLWTAPLYYLLGIPISLYTPLFAASRVAGWCAHYLEVRHEFQEPIWRPRADYVGPAPRSLPLDYGI